MFEYSNVHSFFRGGDPTGFLYLGPLRPKSLNIEYSNFRRPAFAFGGPKSARSPGYLPTESLNIWMFELSFPFQKDQNQ